MKIVLLPGMDGSGILFQAFIKEIQGRIDCIVISYPQNQCLSYQRLEYYVLQKLPKNEDFILLAESFSGPIGYSLAKRNLSNLKAIFFVVTFLRNPNKLLIHLVRFIPVSFLTAFPLPDYFARKFFFDNKTESSHIFLFKKIISSMSSKVLAYRIRELLNLSIVLDKIEIKAYYIQALNDKLVPTDNIECFTKISNNLQVLKINGPHFILQTHAKECVAFILNEIRHISSK